MANSTTNLDTLSASASAKDVVADELFDAMSPASLFGRKASTSSGLTWGFYGGKIIVDGVLTTINNGTVALTASNTNYVEVDRAGTVSKNTTGFTAGRIPLYEIVCGVSTVSSYTDWRSWAAAQIDGLTAKSLSSDANYTLTAQEARVKILEVTSSVSLTAMRNVVLPLIKGLSYDVYNGTTGAQSIQFIGATGTGVTVGNGKRCRIACNGTNWDRFSLDA